MNTVQNERVLIATLCAFALALILTPVVRQFAHRRSVLDQPNDRSSHVIPVPRLGGIPIVIGTGLGGLIAAQYIDWGLALIAAAGVLMAMTGLIDDVHPITVPQKYAAQVIAAILAAFAIEPTLAVNVFEYEVRFNGLTANILAAFWILAFINVLNFMDGIDGLVAGVGAIIGFAIPALTSGAGAFMLLPLAGALLGFLAWNTSPASIFMGDVGSQFVGFVLAAGALHWPQGDVRIIPVLIVFSPLLFDTGYTLLRRLYQRQNIFRAHRTHLYQRLVTVGYTHRGVANLYYCMTAVSLAVAVTFMNSNTPVQTLLLAFMSVSGVVYIIAVNRLEKDAITWKFMLPSSGRFASQSPAAEPQSMLERTTHK